MEGWTEPIALELVKRGGSYFFIIPRHYRKLYSLEDSKFYQVSLREKTKWTQEH